VTGGLVSKWERGICRPTAFHRRLLCLRGHARGAGLQRSRETGCGPA
jgi:hypothetical protein